VQDGSGLQSLKSSIKLTFCGFILQAGMAELADAADSKSADLRVLGVRLPLPAPLKSMALRIKASSDSLFYAKTMPKLELISTFAGG
jgi:hypothetical protein